MARVAKLPFHPPGRRFEVRVIGEAPAGDSLPPLYHIARGPSLTEVLLRSATAIVHRLEADAQDNGQADSQLIIIRMEVTKWNQ